MIASQYMGLGDTENAIKWLEIDQSEGGLGVFYWGLKSDIKFDEIRDEPKFIDLLVKEDYE